MDLQSLTVELSLYMEPGAAMVAEGAGTDGGSGEPTWLLVVGALAPAVTALVAVAIAVAGYFRYVRGRVLNPRLTLELSGEVVTVKDSPALRVQVTVRNDGQSGVVLDPYFTQSLTVFRADDPVWRDACRHDDGVVLWFDGVAPHREVEVLEDRGIEPYDVRPFGDTPVVAGGSARRREVSRVDRHVLEPGERERRALLVPVSDAHAYMLQLTIHACSHAGPLGRRRHRRCERGEDVPHQWRARAIVVPERRPRRRWRWRHE